MTLYFWDASDFDWDRGPMNLVKARAAGIVGFTHKATEGTTTKHGHLKAGLERARDAGVPFIGAYMVPRTPGNGGNGSITAQVAFFLDYLHAQVPWLLGYRGGFAQVDTEIWSSNTGVYDHVSPANGHSAAVMIKSKSGLVTIHYAPRWAYGNAVPGTEPLWSSDYEGGSSSSFTTRYRQCGGTTGPGWSPYGTPKRRPVLWQFAGGTVTVGSQPGCDVSAFEGTLTHFYQLIGAPMATHDPLTIADANVVWHNSSQPGGGVRDMSKPLTPKPTLVSPAGGLEVAQLNAIQANSNASAAVAGIAGVAKQLTALTAIVSGTDGVDAAASIKAIGDEESTIVSQLTSANSALTAQIAALQQELDDTKAALNAALASPEPAE